MQVYSENDERTRRDRKAAQARERRARKAERREAHRVLDEMKVLELENALRRAPRSEKGQDGRTLRLRANVASMVRQMIFWEGKGEADGDWIYKTREEWFQEAGLTYRMLRVARDVARDEGLLDYEERGPKGQTLVYYKLDMAAVLRVVAASELEVARDWLKRHPRSKKRPGWVEKRKRWERLLEDLRAWGVSDASDASGTDNPKLGLATDTGGTDPLTKSKGSPDKKSPHQESTSRGFPLTEDSSGGAGSVASPSPTPPAPSPAEEQESTEPEEDDVETYERLYPQVVAILGGDCTSASARENVGPLVECHLYSDGREPSAATIAKVLRHYVGMRPGDEGMLPGLVDEVLEEMCAEQDADLDADDDFVF